MSTSYQTPNLQFSKAGEVSHLFENAKPCSNCSHNTYDRVTRNKRVVYLCKSCQSIRYKPCKVCGKVKHVNEFQFLSRTCGACKANNSKGIENEAENLDWETFKQRAHAARERESQQLQDAARRKAADRNEHCDPPKRKGKST